MAIDVTFDPAPTAPSSTDKTNFRVRYDVFLAYIVTFVTKLISFVAQINSTEANINAKEESAVAASVSAVALANYKGIFVQGTSSSHVGESWSYNGSSYRCAINTSNNPEDEPESWVSVSMDAVIHAATNNVVLQDDDEFGLWGSLSNSVIKISYINLKAILWGLFVPTGKIDYFSMKTAPTGYLKANGSDISRTIYSNLFAAICPTYGNVTSISNGIGAIVTTPTAHGRVLNDPITFTTSGALPNGLVAGTTYYVSGTVTSTTFQLSATIGGALITTSSAGVGTHTLIYVPFGTSPGGTTTFLLPDLRGEFIRSWDDSRGIDSSRVFGSLQVDSFKAHTHAVTSPSYAGSVGNGAGIFGGVSGTQAYTSSSVGGTETRPRNIALLACIKY